MYRFLVFVLCFGISFTACKSDKSSSYPTKDLLKHGFAINVKAPEDAEIKSDDFGIMQSLSIQKGNEYNIEIFKSETTTTNSKEALQGQIALVKTDPYFSKIIEEYENGIIFEKKIDDNINYDFRYVKLVGDKEYVYQTGMVGTYTEESVRAMYNSVQ